MIALFEIIVLIFSVVIHEVSHGFVAEKLGDKTARFAGRLTLNPIKHLDFFGSFLLPLSLYFLSSGSFMFGWAKPVPYNPLNLKNPLRDGGIIALAGPLSNFLIALFFGLILRLGSYELIEAPIGILFTIIVYINLLLAIFNLIPIPPLDGSKILFGFLPQNQITYKIMRFLEIYGLFLLLIFIFWGFSILILVIRFLFKLIVGSGF